MSARNNNQNPNNFEYDAFMKIQLQDCDLYYHFYLKHNRRGNFRFDVKMPRIYENIIRPDDHQTTVRVYIRPGLTDDQWDLLHQRYFNRIYRRFNIDPDEVTHIYWDDETHSFESDD